MVSLQASPKAPSATPLRPVVAIVGRPNVGKSTLFNRILGRREAIIEQQPGTTRDRIYADVQWEGKAFTLVDTAGLDFDPQGELALGAQAQARLAVADASVLLFMVDTLAGITPVDQDVAGLLRRSGKPVVLVANKADNRGRELMTPEFYALGLGEPMPVSAYHGTGVHDLMERIADVLPPPTPLPAPAGVKAAIVGRPNVGKSLLVNAILGEERLLVSAEPGTTRDAVDTVFSYRDQAMTLIDTAGVRRPGRVQAGVERYSVLRALQAIQRADVAVLVLDAAEGVTAQDLHVAGYVQEAYRGLVLAVNKWDLAPALGLRQGDTSQRVSSHLKFFPHAPVVFVSAKLQQGISLLLDAVLRVQKEREKRLPTAVVNQCIQRAQVNQPAPAIRGRQLKIRYATQADTDPPTFVLFVNDEKLLHFSYRRYLENRLREAFGFAGTPLKLVYQSRREA